MALINAPSLPDPVRTSRSSTLPSTIDPGERQPQDDIQDDNSTTVNELHGSTADVAQPSGHSSAYLVCDNVPSSTLAGSSHLASLVARGIILERSNTACSSIHAGSSTPSEPSLEASSPVPLILINDEKPLPCDRVAIMSGNYYFNPNEQEESAQEDFPLTYQPPYTTYATTSPPTAFSTYAVPAQMMQHPQQRQSINPQQILQSQPNYSHTPPIASTTWRGPAPVVQQQLSNTAMYGFPGYHTADTSILTSHSDDSALLFSQMPTAGPSTSYLTASNAGPSRSRPQRTASDASRASSVGYNTDGSQGVSPNAAEMSRWGTRNDDGTWSCSHPECRSTNTFSRGCDLRKHYKRHTKTLFCRYEGCPQATRGGFSDKKDRQRHESRHNPQVDCEWEGCTRLFSRVDNMKDHVRRVHLKQVRRGR